MAAVEVTTIPYEPRTAQHWAIHDALEAKRFTVAVCHRRFGKTVLVINHLLKHALICARERPRYAYIAPTLKQGKTVAWDYLRKYAGVVPGVTFNEAELRSDLPNGGQVRIFGADNPDSLRGIYLDGVGLDEYGLMQGRVWSEVVRPALSDRIGWAVFIGTPNGRNSFWDLRNVASTDEEWNLIVHKASETNLIARNELESARKMMTPDEFQQEFECSFEASVRGAIYADQMIEAREANRICAVPWTPHLPVDTAWDLGISDSTPIWFYQRVRGERRFIDYYEASGEGLPHYAAVLQRKPYVYGKHIAPHDIRVRELGSGLARIDVARSLGLNFTVAPQMSLQDGIHAARLSLPNSWFDEVKCRAGLEALQSYRWEENTRLDEFRPTPVHDWASHGADAYRMFAVADREPKPDPKAKEARRQFYGGANGAWMG